MKRLLRFLFAAVLIAGAAACNERQPQGNGGKTEVDDKGNVMYTTDCITPICYAEKEFNASEAGVSVKVTEDGPFNLKFTCTPGADVKSYLVQVYPMSSLYNTLINQLNYEGLESYTVGQVNDWIQEAITYTASSTSGGNLMNAGNLAEDYAEYEFDYMNDANLHVFTILPDVDYLIVTLACFDEAGTDYGDMTVCHVTTQSCPTIGDPQINIEVTPGYTSYGLNFVPNEDCEYFYFLSAEEAEIQEYVDAYGEKMYHDFIMNFSTEPVPVTQTFLSYSISNQDPSKTHRVTAVALDGNMVPSSKTEVVNFSLLDAPPTAEVGDCEITEFTAVTSWAARFTVEMDKSCRYVFYKEYPLSQAQEIMNSDEETKAYYAEYLSDYGWASSNENFSFDTEAGVATGGSYTDTYAYVSNVGTDSGANNIDPDSEYAILYVGRNYYRQLTELKMSEPFKTKVLVRDNPDACKANEAKLEIPSTSRTSVVLRYTYDPTVTSVLYYQYFAINGEPISDIDGEGNTVIIYDGMPGDVLSLNEDRSNYDEWKENRDTWLYYFIDWRDPSYGFRWPNQTDCIVIPEDPDFNWFGFQPGNTYEFAYLAEDYDGVLGHVGKVTAKTAMVEGGDSPEVRIDYEVNDDGTYDFTFTANDDTRLIRYMVATEGNGAYNSLYVGDVVSKSVTYNEAESYWREMLLGDDALSSQNTTTVSNEFKPSGKVTVALAMAVGGADAGNPVYGPLTTLFIWADGTTDTLESHFGMATASYRVSLTGAHAPQLLSTTAPKRLRASEVE